MTSYANCTLKLFHKRYCFAGGESESLIYRRCISQCSPHRDFEGDEAFACCYFSRRHCLAKSGMCWYDTAVYDGVDGKKLHGFHTENRSPAERAAE